MDKQQTQQPVAWLKYPRKKPELMQISLSELLPVALKNSGWVSVPLYDHPPAPPVPRDVLMAVANEVLDETILAIAEVRDASPVVRDIVDRYASKVQPEPVNQQQAGVYRKFNVSRTDGRDQPGGDRHGAEYFVLDVTHDKFAKPALAAYAAACRDAYPSLADDMVRRYAIAAEAAQPVGVYQAVSVTDERAAFEAWAKENCCAAGGINFKRFDVGGGDEIYDDPSVETSYQAYLAGARQQPASTQPTDEAVAWMTQGTDGPVFYTVKPVNGLERFTPLYHASAKPVVVLPKYDVFSRDDGDSWEEHPASDCFVHGRKLGDEFELLAGWTARRVTFLVTKVPDEESDDYEVEQVDVLRCSSQSLVDALEKLARLGAGDRYGNSDGNVIAQQALAEYRSNLSAAQKPEGE